MKRDSLATRMVWGALNGMLDQGVRVVDERRAARKAFERGVEAGLERGYRVAVEDMQAKAAAILGEATNHDIGVFPAAGSPAADVMVMGLRELAGLVDAEPPGVEVVDGD